MDSLPYSSISNTLALRNEKISLDEDGVHSVQVRYGYVMYRNDQICAVAC